MKRRARQQQPGGHLGVIGPRSPRWAFMKKTTIPCDDGLVYLVRLRIVQTPWFGLYLHDIREPDNDYDPHDHPWPFISIILRGGYVEEVHPTPWVDVRAGVYRRRWLPPSAHRMGTETAHRIVHVEPKTISLILVGPRRRNWGFHTRDGFVPWQEYKACESTKFKPCS